MTGGETSEAAPRYVAVTSSGENDMRGILLWLVGIPIPVIILLYLFHIV